MEEVGGAVEGMSVEEGIVGGMAPEVVWTAGADVDAAAGTTGAGYLTSGLQASGTFCAKLAVLDGPAACVISRELALEGIKVLGIYVHAVVDLVAPSAQGDQGAPLD